MLGRSMFPGGVHPKEDMNGKSVTSILPVAELPQPSRVIIPLQQHIGAPCKCLVEKGDHVDVGQMIGQPQGFVSAAVHSSVSGTVVSVTPSIMANGLEVMCVVIDNDFHDTWAQLKPRDPNTITAKELSELARELGLVGLGGATFPTAVKLAVPPEKKVDTLILNGAECEPYLSADHRLMLEFSDQIVKGASLIQRVLAIDNVIIGIEKNKPDAVETMRQAINGYSNMRVEPLPVKYPQGGEKQLCYALTGRKVKAGALPLDSGVIVCNVGTCYALCRAVYEGRPVIDRIVTVGGCVKKPANYLARVGTPVEWLIDTSEGLLPETRKLIYGGPMMGMAISRLDIPVTKGCSGIVALSKATISDETACIRCGRCYEVCPMHLAPSQIDRYMRNGMYEEAEKAAVMNCIECGACSWSCPAKRNLTQSCRTCKKIITQRRKEAAAKGEK